MEHAPGARSTLLVVFAVTTAGVCLALCFKCRDWRSWLSVISCGGPDQLKFLPSHAKLPLKCRRHLIRHSSPLVVLRGTTGVVVCRKAIMNWFLGCLSPLRPARQLLLRLWITIVVETLHCCHLHSRLCVLHIRLSVAWDTLKAHRMIKRDTCFFGFCHVC